MGAQAIFRHTHILLPFTGDMPSQNQHTSGTPTQVLPGSKSQPLDAGVPNVQATELCQVSSSVPVGLKGTSQMAGMFIGDIKFHALYCLILAGHKPL